MKNLILMLTAAVFISGYLYSQTEQNKSTQNKQKESMVMNQNRNQKGLEEVIEENSEQKNTDINELQNKKRVQNKKHKQEKAKKTGAEKSSDMLEKNAQKMIDKAQQIKNEIAKENIEKSAEKMIEKAEERVSQNNEEAKYDKSQEIKNRISNKGASSQLKHKEKHSLKKGRR